MRKQRSSARGGSTHESNNIGGNLGTLIQAQATNEEYMQKSSKGV